VNHTNVYYGDYLQLDRILNAQHLESVRHGDAAHDEMLFIITHQAYELWFNQIIHELRSIIGLFSGDQVDDKQMGVVIARLQRIRVIQQLLLQQIDVIETMTPLDFLEFRDLLVPASGFQSLQFKEIEIRLGLKRAQRSPADRSFFMTRLRDEDRAHLEQMEDEPSLFELTDDWLSRMPFTEFESFDFWKAFDAAVQQMLESDRMIIESNPTVDAEEKEFQLGQLEATGARFDALLDKDKYEALRESGEVRFSQRATLSALFINLYRDQPILFLPFKYLTHLAEIDEHFTAWRARHAMMVQRMLGRKIGTGGSSGHDYLATTTQQNRVFTDLFTLSTFLIRRSALPVLPDELVKTLGFQFGR
jgi:tryptophan 2,3-dioxygenase